MASSTARSPRLLRDIASPMGSRSTPSRGANDDAGRPAAAGPASSAREPAWLLDLLGQINRSIDSIEHMVERVGTIRSDNSYLRAMTANLREALEVERVDNGRKLVAQDLSMSQEKRRSADAERSADALAGMLCDLERQISGREAREARASGIARESSRAASRPSRGTYGATGQVAAETDAAGRIRRYA